MEKPETWTSLEELQGHLTGALSATVLAFTDLAPATPDVQSLNTSTSTQPTAVESPSASGQQAPSETEWKGVVMWPLRDDTGWGGVEAGLFSLTEARDGSKVCVVTGGETTLDGLSVELEHERMGVVFASCADVTLSNSSFKGGAIICHGKGCNMKLRNVNFHDSCLVVVEGATVTIEESSFFISSTIGQGLSLFAHGQGTTVNVVNTTIRGGVQGVASHAGAHLSAEQVEVSGTTFAGVVCRYEDSRLTMTKSIIKDMHATHDGDLNSCHGICVLGGSATITNVDVQSGQCSLSVSRSNVLAEDCKFEGCVYTCVKVVRDAEARFVRCTMAGSQRKHGIAAEGCPCNVDVEDCKFMNNKQRGAVCHDGASVHLRHCTSVGNGRGGYCAQSKWSTLSFDVRDCFSEGDGEGCRVSGTNATCVVENLTVERAAEYGLHAFDGATMEAANCTVKSCGAGGVLATGGNTDVTVTGGTFEANGECAVLVALSASCVVRDATSSGHDICGFQSRDVDSTLEVEKCRSSDPEEYKHDNEATILVDGKRDVKMDSWFAKIFTCFG